jgi:hypothetical protein
VKLNHGIHLAYCTNVHRGETWAEVFTALQSDTLAVRDRVSPDSSFAIGLRLSDRASRELYVPAALESFRRWLKSNDCYVFTINGFPFGRFHGERIKEQVFRPDWTATERLDYTVRLFQILVELLPDDVEGSVSTLPGSHKDFIREAAQVTAIQHNLWRCIEEIEALSQRSGRRLHLGLEPEPFGLIENTPETIVFFKQMETLCPHDPRLSLSLGINYDTCHFALQFEEARPSLHALVKAGIRISKLHLSSALRLKPDAAARKALRAFVDDVYLHQVIGLSAGAEFVRYRDLPLALVEQDDCEEWRVHFHIPLYSPPGGQFCGTSENLLATLDWLTTDPTRCSHLEMETYTWEVLPENLKAAKVVDQLTREYEWILPHLRKRGLAL